MRRVIAPSEMAEIDRRSIEVEGIPGLTLMEKAGRSVADAAREMLASIGGRRLAVFCGKGNNGGDGFVVARMLSSGFDVVVFVAGDISTMKSDARVNYERVSSMRIPVVRVTSERDLDAFSSAFFDLVVDGLFGTGFTGTAEGVFSSVIDAINTSGCPVLAIDIPSGVSGSTGATAGPAIKADRTVTFAALKVGLVQHPGAGLAGEVEVADIGIPPKLIEEVPETRIFILDEEDAQALIPDRSPDANKGSCGHVLVVGGSSGMAGAPAMCARAAVRSGSGLVTVAVPASLQQVLEIKLTEELTVGLPDEKGSLDWEAVEKLAGMSPRYDVMALGPGLGADPWARDVVPGVLRSVGLPIVLDADGLNSLAGRAEVLKERTAPTVLTPHPGEMARLLGTTVEEVQSDRVGCALGAAREWGVIMVLKGAGTVVASPDGEVIVNSTGNPGMATGGMGDVLTGLIASLIGQGAAPFDAASAGVYFHGLAADLVASMDGMIGMTAGDVTRHLPLAMRKPSAGR